MAVLDRELFQPVSRFGDRHVFRPLAASKYRIGEPLPHPFVAPILAHQLHRLIDRCPVGHPVQKLKLIKSQPQALPHRWIQFLCGGAGEAVNPKVQQQPVLDHP